MTKPIYGISIPSYHLDAAGNHHPMLAKEWDGVCADLDALDATLDATETVQNQHYATWRRESILLVPAATFMWLDEFQAAWNCAFSEECMQILVEGWAARPSFDHFL